MDSKLVVEQMAGPLEDQAPGHAPAGARGARRRRPDQRGRWVGVVHLDPARAEQGRRRPVQRRHGRPDHRPACSRRQRTAADPSDRIDGAGSTGRRPASRSSTSSSTPMPRRPAGHRAVAGGRRRGSCWCATASPTSPWPRASTGAAGPTRRSTPRARPRPRQPGGPSRTSSAAAPARVVTSSPGPRASDRGARWPRRSGSTPEPTTTGTSRTSVTGTARASPTWSATTRDELAATARRPGIHPSRWGVARRAGRARRRRVRAGRRRGRHHGRGLPPQADHVRPRARARASRTTRCGGWPRPAR